MKDDNVKLTFSWIVSKLLAIRYATLDVFMAGSV
jgi:hypothetical protein